MAFSGSGGRHFLQSAQVKRKECNALMQKYRKNIKN